MISIEENNIFCLSTNIVLWFLIFVIYQYKIRYFGIGSAILLFYLMIAISAVHLFYSPYSWMFGPLNLFAFFYLAIMIILAIYPILALKEKKLQQISSPTPLLFNTVCIIIIFFSFAKFPSTLLSIKENFLAIIIDESAGAQAYGASTGGYVSKSASEGDIVSIISGMCCGVSMSFLCYYLTKKKKNKLILLGLILSSLMMPLYGITNGSRSGIASFIINFIFILIFIRGTISKEIRQKIYRYFSIAAVILLIPFFTVTLSRRSGDLEMSVLSIERYFAEGPLRFNNYGLDAGGIRYGDNTIVAFKKVAGLDPAMYYKGRLMKYRNMKIDESVFYTFVGDFTLDFGPLVAFMIFILLAIIFRRLLYIRKGKFEFWQYLLAYVLITSCLGYYQFPYGRETGNVQLIMFLLLIILFWCDSKINRYSHN